MTEPTYKLTIIPDQLIFSARHAITQAAGCQVTAEANAIIQATLDYLTDQPAVPAMLMTSAMRAELVDDTAATFYANGPETPQVVRDVIEYVDSWLQVQLGRAQDAAQATHAAPDALQAANAARIQAQMEVANLKERLAGARINLMKDLREQGWTPPDATPMAARLREAEDRLYDMALGDDGQAWSSAYRYLERERPDLYQRVIAHRPPKAAPAPAPLKLNAEREFLESWLQVAAEPQGLQCCGRGRGGECCGNAEAVYLTGEQVLELMNKRRQEIVAELQKLEGGAA